MVTLDEDEYKKVVSNFLKSHRKTTQAQLAEEAQISEYSISAVERELSIMTSFNLLKVCLSLGVTPNDMFEEFLPNKKELVTDKIINELADLTEEEQEMVLSVIKVIKKKKQ